jgi:proteic killer suppression protein
MKIRSFAHKGLKRLFEDDNAKGVPPETVDKLRKMFAFLDAMQQAEELRRSPYGRFTHCWATAMAHGV